MTGVQDRSAPGVRIITLADAQSSKGTPVDLKDRIISFSYEDSDTQADKVSLELDNGDLSLFEDNALVGGAMLEVSWGYPGNMTPPRRAVIKKVKGFSHITLEGYALSILMNQEAKTRSWTQLSKAEVARQIAAEHGYEGAFIDIESTSEVLDTINQTAETDARFLQRLAALEGFSFYIDHTGFHFHQRKKAAAPSRILTYVADPGRGDILSVSVDSDLRRRVGRVEMRGRDPLNKTTIIGKANAKTTNRPTLGEVIEVVDPETGTTALQTRNATVTVHPSPANTIHRIKQQSDARFRQADQMAIKLSITTVGDPTLSAKSVIDVRGISSLFSGKYYVKKVKHSITSSGYIADLELIRDGVNRKARPKAQTQGGQPNVKAVNAQNTLETIELVDPDTGHTRLTYRRTDQPLHGSDPEAMR